MLSLASPVLAQVRAQPPAPVLVYLCHRRQDLVAVASETEGVAEAIGATTILQGWSEDWYVTSGRPPRYTPPSVVVWHARMDLAPPSVDPGQAGYQPSAITAGLGDRRRVPSLRTRVTVEWWPLYVDEATGETDALAKAKAQWVDAIYSAGRPMTLDEWVAYTGFRQVKPAWFDPKPLPWAGLRAVGGAQTVAWRRLPVATTAPYDAAIKLPTVKPDASNDPGERSPN